MNKCKSAKYQINYYNNAAHLKWFKVWFRLILFCSITNKHDGLKKKRCSTINEEISVKIK